jgi:Flp pilus assembly protein TadG
MLPRTRQKRIKRHGAATVEFAFTAPVLFLFIFAIFEFGRAFMVIDLLNDAARVGCREGAVQGISAATITSDVQTRLQGEGVNGASVAFKVNSNSVSDLSAANSGDAITVQVSVPVSSITWTSANFVTGSLSGQSTMGKQ